MGKGHIAKCTGTELEINKFAEITKKRNSKVIDKLSELPKKENKFENEEEHEKSNVELHDSINDYDDTIKAPSTGRKKRKAAAKANLIFEVLDEIMDTDEVPAK